MLLPIFLLLQADSSTDEMDKLLKARDVAGLSALMTDRDPTYLRVIKTNGAYDTGNLGWKSLELKGVDGGDYVIFSTPITSEDIGEMLFRRHGSKLDYIPESDAMGIKLIRHGFDLRFDLTKKRAILEDSLQLASIDPGKKPFFFRMSPQYKVSSITSGGKPVPFAQAGGIVSAQRPEGQTTYLIQYSAVVNLPQYAGSISTKIASLTNDYWYPMVARQPSPYDITVHTPKDWLPVCQGVQIGQPKQEGEGIATSFRMDLPCVYFSVTAAPLKVVQAGIKGKTYKTWSLRMTKEQMATQNEVNQDVIDFYGKSFGGWPFNSWGSLDSDVYGGGALEAYSYATYGGGLPSIDAHEPSHTFWGGVLCNTYLRSFWNESFADFSDGFYHRQGPIGNIAEKRLAFVADSQPEPDYNDLPIMNASAFAGPVASSLGYGKGAKVLQMLEQVLGTELMLKTMRDWVKADAGKDVSWEDYEKIVYKDAGMQRTKPFFDDWLRKPGFAQLNVSQPKLAGKAVSFNVGFKGESYVMPLEVMVENVSGKRFFSTVLVTKPGSYSVAVQGKPRLISFDPYFKALRTREKDEAIMSIQGLMRSMKRYQDPKQPDYLSHMRKATETAVPSNLNGAFLVGHPDTTPQMRALCAKAGFVVKGNKLTWQGTTIDLNVGGAIAVVDLPGGGTAMVGLGKIKLSPNVGTARLALFDQYGRFLRGVAEPKTKGSLAFRL